MRYLPVFILAWILPFVPVWGQSTIETEQLHVLQALADEGIYEAHKLLAQRIIEHEGTLEGLTFRDALLHLYRSAATGNHHALKWLGHYYVNRRYQHPQHLFEGLIYLSLASQLDSEEAIADLWQISLYSDISLNQMDQAYFEAAKRLLSGQLLTCDQEITLCPDPDIYRSRIKPEYYFAAQRLVQANPSREIVTAMQREKLGEFTNYTKQRQLKYLQNFAKDNQRMQRTAEEDELNLHPLADPSLVKHLQERKDLLLSQAQEYFSHTSALDDPEVVHKLTSLLERINLHRQPGTWLTLESLRVLLSD